MALYSPGSWKGWLHTMLKKHLLFLLYQIKSAMKALPRLVMCTVIFGLIIAVAGICGNSILGDDSDNFVKLKIAAVMPSGDPAIAAGFSIISNMDSMKSVCSFVALERDEAIDGLKKGDISAIIEIPPNFANDLMYGVNTPATVIIPDNAGTESLLFCSMIDAGGQSLAYSESGIYAVLDLFNNHGFDDYASLAGDELYEYYFKYTLNRGTFFDNRPISVTGASSSGMYYLCTGVVLMVLLGMLTVTDRFSSRPAAVTESLRIHRISTGFIKLSELAGVTLLFFVIFAAITTVSGFAAAGSIIKLSPALYAVIFLVILSISAFAMFICSISDGGLVSVLLIFITSCAMLYASGRIVPGAYLLPWIEKTGRLYPAYGWCSLLESALCGKIQASFVLMTAGYGLAFTILSILASYIRGREK